MERVAFVVAAVGIAVALFVNAYRCGRRRGNLPLMLERTGGAFIALFVGLLLFADAVFGLWMALLVIAVALMAGSSVARWREEAAQEQLLASKGGPSRQRVTLPWLVAVVVAAAVAVPFLVASIVLIRWGESLTRVSQVVNQSDGGQAAVLAGEVQQLTLGLMLSLTATAVLPLVAAGIAGYLQHCRRRSVREVYEDALALWADGRSYGETSELAVELEVVKFSV